MLERRLGVRLLTRTTRSVSTTEAGERLLQSIGPHVDGIEAGLAALSELRDKPAGSLRITSVEHASQTILAPVLAKLLPNYPDISVEIINDYGLSDIVADRFDAGIRLGEQVAQDMIAVRIGPDFRMTVVGSPAYFKDRKPPVTPHELTAHACIRLRLPTSGGLWSWPFAKKKRELKVRPQGRLAFNTIALAHDMAVAGLGLAYLPQDVVSQKLAAGKLIQVLADWSTTSIIPPVVSRPRLSNCWWMLCDFGHEDHRSSVSAIGTSPPFALHDSDGRLRAVSGQSC
jgi:DNA-binding transcriptional LysR family regulator